MPQRTVTSGERQKQDEANKTGPQIRHVLTRAMKGNSFICLHLANTPPPGFWVVPLSSIHFHQGIEIAAVLKQGNACNFRHAGN